MDHSDILLLVEETRNNVTKLRNQFAKEKDVDRRAERADESMNTVTTFVTCEGSVLYPYVQAHLPADQAAARLHAASMRLRRLQQDMAHLESVQTDANEYATLLDGTLGRFLVHYDASHALLVELRRHLDTSALEALAKRWRQARENVSIRSLVGNQTTSTHTGDAGPLAGKTDVSPVSLSQRVGRIADDTEDLVKRMAQEARLLQQPPHQPSEQQATTAGTGGEAAKGSSADDTLDPVSTIGIIGPKELAKLEKER
ncbi:hypothetical protein BGZ73_001319 [Actinomortierella ambigua]|nr:hypothetical protein BGZ73_001319 [Actinomortierella ambigua]